MLILTLILMMISANCLAQSNFTEEEINDEVFQRIQGKSWKKNCTINRGELRYLKVLHYNFEGNIQQGELICNKAISKDLLEIFEALYEAKYPIAQIRLIDDFDADDEKSMSANNTSCFNFRKISGSNKLSKHATGMAIDINPLLNPLVGYSKGKKYVRPTNAQQYSNRTKSFSGKINKNDLCYKLFTAHGFRWGGSWKNSKDYQHFEK